MKADNRTMMRMLCALGSADGKLDENSPLAGALHVTKSNIAKAFSQQPVVAVKLRTSGRAASKKKAEKAA